MTGYTCPDCGGELLVRGDGHEYECERCGNVITKATYIERTAAAIRSEGYDDLADRLEAAARRGREASDR